LHAALEVSDDALRVFRIADDAELDLYYQNRIAEISPEVSGAELREAFVSDDGTILRGGLRADSVVELQARRFAVGAEQFVVTTERDVTQRDRIERGYEEAATLATERADRYLRLGFLFAEPAATQADRIRRVLGFVLRELKMGSALFAVTRGAPLRSWSVLGDPSRRTEIPDSFVRSAFETAEARHGIPWKLAAAEARFSSVWVQRGESERAVLCLGNRAGGSARLDDPIEFLRLCAMLCTLCSERYLNGS